MTAEKLFALTGRLTVNFDATLRYWSIYRAAADSARLREFFEAGDIETNGVVVVRNGMLRLVVLNLRRALEPAKNDNWSMMKILELLPKDDLHRILSNPLVAKKSGIGDLERRVAGIEICRSQITARFNSDDAAWIKDLRHKDVAHAEMGSDHWDERTASDLHRIVLETADEAYRLCDAISRTHTAEGAYRHVHEEAEAFWNCFRPPGYS